jgi:hypothetical protein
MERAAKHSSGFAAMGAGAMKLRLAISPRSPPASSEEHAFEQVEQKPLLLRFAKCQSRGITQMKRIIGFSVTVMAAMLFVSSGWAYAKQICLSFDGTNPDYNLNISGYPAKNHCKPISMTDVNGFLPGYLASGSLCRASDKDTLLFTVSNAYFDGLETLQGSASKSSGAGTWADCIIHTTDMNVSCNSSPIFFMKCSNQPIAAAIPGDAAAIPGAAARSQSSSSQQR